MSAMLCLQAVPVAQVHSYSQLYPQQTVFALNEAAGRLYAAGGAAPSIVHTWDMSQERCTQQVGPCNCVSDIRSNCFCEPC